MGALRLRWILAGGVAVAFHLLPLVLMKLDLVGPPPPEVVTIELSTFVAPPAADEEAEPGPPAPPEPPPETPPKPRPPEPPPPEPPPPEPPEPAPEPPPTEPTETPPVETAAVTPTPVPAAGGEPSEGAVVPSGPTSSSSGEPTGEPGPAVARPPPPPPPPPGPSFDPRAYRNVAFGLVDRHKRYPRKARVLGQQGRVILMVYLDREGRLVKDPVVRRSSGVEELDEEAVRMVKAAAPFPKPKGNITRVPILVPLTIHFRLEDP